MKIAYIVGEYGEISETFTRDLANGFVSEGHSVSIFCSENKNKDLFSNPHNFDDIKETQFNKTSLLTKIRNKFDRIFLTTESRQRKLFEITRKNATQKLIPILKESQPLVEIAHSLIF